VIIETVVSAKTLWFLEMRNLNPRGRNLYKIIVPKLQQWYGFTAPEEFDEKKGVRFGAGEFSPSERGEDWTGIELTIFNDGFVAMSTTSTDDTDTFLQQVGARLAKENLITFRPEMVKRKIYASEVIARSEKNLVIPQLEPVNTILASILGTASAGPVSWTGLMLDVDPLTPAKQVPFKLERRATVPFSENLWYSHGPLSTKQHHEILNALEEALSVSQ
jgi:hypothetical protein